MTHDCIVLQVFSRTSQNNLLHDFTGPVVSRVLLLALLENQDNVPSFQSAGTSLDSPDCSEIIKRGFMMASAAL